MICLYPDEIFFLTKKKRYRSQIKALTTMRVPYRVRPDGSPLVMRCDLVQEVGSHALPVMISTDFSRVKRQKHRDEKQLSLLQ